jgi:acyl-coenzyme A thioesterase PaaI-like protein
MPVRVTGIVADFVAVVVRCRLATHRWRSGPAKATVDKSQHHAVSLIQGGGLAAVCHTLAAYMGRTDTKVVALCVEVCGA